MASVRYRSGSWQARWYLANGKLRSETHTGWTKSAALKHAQRMEDAASRMPWVTTGPAQAPDVVDYGLRVLGSRSISKQRLQNDRAAWNNRIAPHFAGLRITQVTPDDIRGLVVELSQSYAPSTVRDTYGLIRYVFETAMVDGLLAATPCVRISLPRRLPEDEVVPAPRESVYAISEAIDPRYRLLVRFLAATGCRVGEALAVTSDSLIWLPSPRVTISRTMHDDGSTGPAKSRRSRTIVLPSWIIPELSSSVTSGQHWLFPSPRGGPLPPRRFSGRFWRPATIRAGFPTVTPHQLRHLHATELLAMGRPITEVASRLGHASPKITMEVYAKWIQPDDSGAAAVVPDYSEPLKVLQL